MTCEKVSVVIPACKSERTIGKCLSSVLEQTYPDYEVIVVDSGPGDETRHIVENLQVGDENIRYMFEENPGIGNARLKGELASRGSIILMTDSDCTVLPGWMERMTGPIISGRCVAVQGLKKAAGRSYWTGHVEREEHDVMRSFFRENGTSLVDTANFVVRKDVLAHIGFSDGNLLDGNDTDLAARLSGAGYNVMLKDVFVYHRHPFTALRLFRKMFRRGGWYCRMRRRHMGSIIFRRQTLSTTAGYIAGLFSDMVRLEDAFFYHLLTGVSWRLGLMWGHVRK